MTRQRGTARDLAIRIASRLRDPGQVAAAAGGIWDALPGWGHASLAYGHPGIALLFAELGHEDRGYLTDARNHLVEAVRGTDLGLLDGGLFGGFAGLGFAAQATARSPRDCLSITTECGRQTAQAAAVLGGHLAAGPDQLAFEDYDVINGLAGMARYLLRQRGPFDPGVVAATSVLANFARGEDTSRWLASGWINPALRDSASRVHVNLGLAHGIAGPLAFLAIARMAGVRVPGMVEGINRIAGYLTTWYQRGGGGGNWPAALSATEQGAPGQGVTEQSAPGQGATEQSAAEQGARRPARAGDPLAWCYGTPGVARSLQLAARAVGDRRWATIAGESMRTAIAVLLSATVPGDVAMCHGWAGVLTAARLLAATDPALDLPIDAIASRLITAYRADAELGFEFLSPVDAWPGYVPGLLVGAAGVALALWTYGTGSPSTVAWEDAFALS